MATAKDLGVALRKDRQEHATWLAGFKNAEGELDMPAEKVGEFHTRNADISAKQAAYEAALEVEKADLENSLKLAPTGRAFSAEEPATKDTSGLISTKEGVDAALKSFMDGAESTFDAIRKTGHGTYVQHLPISLKTLVTTADFAPQADRQAATPSALYYGDIEDLFQPGTTDSKSVDYYIQTTDTDNAAAVAEGAAATDSAFSWTLTTDPVETVETWIPVTRESLDDNAGFQSMVTGMLAKRLQKKSNQIMLSGTGVTPIPTGVAVRTGVQTQAKGADPAFDAIHKAITLVEVTGDAIADAICFHPTDWQNLRLTRTVDGIYILGNPADSAPLNLWGLPVRKTTAIVAAGTAGTALVGAFRSYAQIMSRGGLTLEVSTEHSTYATERKVAVILYRRFMVADYRPSAFAKVTGL